MKPGWLVPAFLAALLAAAALAVAAQYGVGVPPLLLVGSRWLALAALVGYAWFRASLTTWILVSMVIGAEIGHDWPAAAVNLRILSLIFLRMIKTIIAPLLFGTLVVGIAGHSNLRQVGRMGIKALVYFEVVTTVALFIGLAAINISRAGVGINLPAPTTAPAPIAAAPQSASDIILH